MLAYTDTFGTLYPPVRPETSATIRARISSGSVRQAATTTAKSGSTEDVSGKTASDSASPDFAASPEVQSPLALGTDSIRPLPPIDSHFARLTFASHEPIADWCQVLRTPAASETASPSTAALDYCDSGRCEAPPQVLFPQLATIVQRYIDERCGGSRRPGLLACRTEAPR